MAARGQRPVPTVVYETHAVPIRNRSSHLRTAQQRGLDSADVITTLSRAPAPIISPHFYPTTPSVN
jgi:hypothetical protein